MAKYGRFSDLVPEETDTPKPSGGKYGRFSALAQVEAAPASGPLLGEPTAPTFDESKSLLAWTPPLSPTDPYRQPNPSDPSVMMNIDPTLPPSQGTAEPGLEGLPPEIGALLMGADPISKAAVRLGGRAIAAVKGKLFPKPETLPLYPLRQTAREKMVQTGQQKMEELGFADEPAEIKAAFAPVKAVQIGAAQAIPTIADKLTPVAEQASKALEASMLKVNVLPEQVYTSRTLDIAVTDALTQVVRDLAKRDPEFFVPGEQILQTMKRVGNALKSGNIGWNNFSPEMRDRLKTVFPKPQDMARDFEEFTASFSGKTLNRLSQLQKDLNLLAKGQLDNVPEPPLGLWGKLTHWAHRALVDAPRGIMDTARASLVGQLATQIRNFTMGGVEYGALEGVAEAGLAAERALFKKAGAKEALAPVMEHYFAIARRFSPEGRELLAKFLTDEPLLAKKLYGSPIAGELALTSKYRKIIGWVGQQQEFFVRDVAVDSYVSKELLYRQPALAEKWASLTTAQRQETMKTLWSSIKPGERFKILNSAVTKALELTKAASPTTTLGQMPLRLANAFPPALLVYPFPKYIANAVATNWRYSPGQLISTGFKWSMGGQWQQKVQQMSFEELMTVANKAVIGTGIFWGMWQLRNSKYAGPRSYQIILNPDEEPNVITDIRPQGPIFPAYAFLAEFLKRYQRKQKTGEPLGFTGADYTEGLTAINRIAGSSLYLFNALGGRHVENPEEHLSRFAGEFFGWFSVPAQTFTDLLTPIFPEQGEFKDVRQRPLVGPFLENIPFARDILPERYFPTSTVNERYRTTKRQLTGVSESWYDPLRLEFEKLEVSPLKLEPRTGIKELDNVVRKYMGQILERQAERVLHDPNYLKASKARKVELLSGVVSAAKRMALAQAGQERGDLLKMMKEKDAEKALMAR